MLGEPLVLQAAPILNADLFTSVTPGAAFDSPAAVTTWVLFALLKLMTGTLATEYSRGQPHALSAVQSMIDLGLLMGEVVDEAGGVTSRQEGRRAGATAVKRWYSPSGYAQEKAVVFEASEGDALEDGKVKHYDVDGACTSANVWAGYVF